MKRLFLMVAMLPLVASPALAKDKPKKADAKGEKVICHREISTGSIMPKMVCRTKAEADAAAAQGAHDADQVRQIQTSHQFTQSQLNGQ